MTDIFKSADWAREALSKEDGSHSIVMRDGPDFHFFATLPAGVTPRSMTSFGDYLLIATDEGPLFYDSAGNLVDPSWEGQATQVEVFEPHLVLCGSVTINEPLASMLRTGSAAEGSE